MKKKAAKRKLLPRKPRPTQTPESKPVEFCTSTPSQIGSASTDSPEATLASDSAELAPLRQELGLLHNILTVLKQATIRAHEAKKAAEVMDYLQGKIDVLEAKVQQAAQGKNKGAEMGDAVLQALRLPEAHCE